MQFGTSFRINLPHKKCKDPDERVDNLYAKSIIALNSATLSPVIAAQAATTGPFLSQRTTNSFLKGRTSKLGQTKSFGGMLLQKALEHPIYQFNKEEIRIEL